MRYLGILAVVSLTLAVTATAGANSTAFYAITNELGYEGTVWNITTGAGPWATSTPRDAVLYTVVGFGAADSNNLLSNWEEHGPSNQEDSFLQLGEDGNASMTSAVGGWDATLKVFTLSVTGQNAPWPWSRFWQPDSGMAYGVTFIDYTYSFTATFANPAVPDSGGFTNSGDPTSIVGSFTGTFISTFDVNANPIVNGDTYGFDIDFDSAWFDNNGLYGQIELVNSWGTVPEPLTMAGLALGIGSLATYIRRRRAA